MREILLASHNAHKIAEIKAITEHLNIKLISLSDLGDQDEVIEDGKTFFENAFKKASYFSKKYQLITIADDSGLCVDALGGNPGVYSARYSGLGDIENNIKLLKALEGINDRNAHFISVIVYYESDQIYQVFEGQVEGIIHKKSIGNHGFGYDPIFYYPPLNQTFGQIEMHIKNQISHRAQAVQKFKDYLYEMANH